jgi:hypothetical protein
MTRGWNPWSMAALGLIFVMATALVTGLVVANWSGSSQELESRKQTPASFRSWQSTRAVSVRPAAAPIARSVPVAVAVPTAEAVQDCNRRASDEAGDQDRREEVVKNVTSGGAAAADGGTLYGLDGSRQNDEKYRAAYASCMRARGYIAG